MEGMRAIFLLITFLNFVDCLVLGSAERGISYIVGYGKKKDEALVPALHFKSTLNLSPIYKFPVGAPSPEQNDKRLIQGQAFPPSILAHKHYHRRKKIDTFAPEPSVQPSIQSQQGLVPSISPLSSQSQWGPQGPAPSPGYPSKRYGTSMLSPTISPLSSSLANKHPPPSAFVLPPPPPNEDCTSVTCSEPLTYTPAGSPCACVWPIEVRLDLGISPYTFFSLVTELAKEIAIGVSLNESQTRIMGANAAGEQLDKTIVLIDLVPLNVNFDPATVFSIYRKFWTKQVFIDTSLFGAYSVIYVHYPGLPPSPPSMSPNTASISDQPYTGTDQNGMPLKPLGVDVPRRKEKKTNGSMIAVVVLSSLTALVVCVGLIWLLLLKYGGRYKSQRDKTRPAFASSHGKTSGVAGSLTPGSRQISDSLSYSSSVLAYAGTAKIFSLVDIERATDNFNAQRILGEGGFGVVYSGNLDDGRKVAVKVLKRDDQQGSREFLAEVEMLSRLHHRNLVKLIGICSDDHFRCLVYELVPNGSLESHLHGIDRMTSPLDWCTRMKIALGAARGLAYLHEDSNPRVIHRDFKSSNILLDNDFTPKVSDFGLARTALDEGQKQISTHVMGTFGYLAPEYAMTGHLLVKSDVYSYGVVLLELLTGRKPVDLLQPPGEENLVAWARPLLTNKETLELIIDPNIKSSVPFDSMVKVAAIASMCVQPEVAHRPFMGEVVQALKLVCNEFDEIKETASRSCSREEMEIEIVDDNRRTASDEVVEDFVYDPVFGTNVGLSSTNLISKFEELESESFRRQFNSAPLRMGRRRLFWQRLRGISSGSMSDHAFSSNL